MNARDRGLRTAGVITAALVRGAAAPVWLRSLGHPARLVGADGADGEVLTVGGWPR